MNRYISIWAAQCVLTAAAAGKSIVNRYIYIYLGCTVCTDCSCCREEYCEQVYIYLGCTVCTDCSCCREEYCEPFLCLAGGRGGGEWVEIIYNYIYHVPVTGLYNLL